MSLDGDAELGKDELDVVRLYVYATTLGTGTYTTLIRTSWMFAGVAKSMDGSVTLEVTSPNCGSTSWIRRFQKSSGSNSIARSAA
jgi:hypothetical protein